jgi:hypothetical protein
MIKGRVFRLLEAEGEGWVPQGLAIRDLEIVGPTEGLKPQTKPVGKIIRPALSFLLVRDRFWRGMSNVGYLRLGPAG